MKSINSTCEICGNDEDYSTYFTGQGKCTDCWNYFKRVGSWRNVQRNRSNKLREVQQ